MLSRPCSHTSYSHVNSRASARKYRSQSDVSACGTITERRDRMNPWRCTCTTFLLTWKASLRLYSVLTSSFPFLLLCIARIAYSSWHQISTARNVDKISKFMHVVADRCLQPQSEVSKNTDNNKFNEYAIKVACHYTCVLSYLPSHAYTTIMSTILASSVDRCVNKWWFRWSKLTSSGISDFKPIIYIVHTLQSLCVIDAMPFRGT